MGREATDGRVQTLKSRKKKNQNQKRKKREKEEKTILRLTTALFLHDPYSYPLDGKNALVGLNFDLIFNFWVNIVLLESLSSLFFCFFCFIRFMPYIVVFTLKSRRKRSRGALEIYL